MWFKVEDAKTRISNVITWTIDRTYDANGDPTATYGEITMDASGLFVGYTTSDVVQVSEFSSDSDRVNNELKDSIYIKIKTVTSNDQVVGEIYWPATTSVKNYTEDMPNSKTNTAEDYMETMLESLDELTFPCTAAQILAGDCLTGHGMVQGTDYVVFKLVKGINHAWYPLNSTNILTIVNGKKDATIDDDSMYITTANTYAYTDHSGAIAGPYGTAESTVGHLGPYYNIADSLCQVLIACENTCVFDYGTSVDRWVEKIKRPPTDGGGGGNNNGGGNDDDGRGDPREPRDPEKPTDKDLDKYRDKYRDKRNAKPYKYDSNEQSTRYK